uniref:BCL2 like 12 n=2 Tax=Fundulus heteroclitus TaxID=8078 RepID=A0A147B0X6_FUNHE
MSEPADRRCSVSSVSLIEIKAETHLVLQAFLERALSTSHKERPGRIAGAYEDYNQYSLTLQSKQKDGSDSQAEKEDEKKTGFKDLMKNFPRTSIIRGKGSLGKSSKAKQSHQTDDSLSPSSSSDEDESEKKMKLRQANIKKKLASFFKKKVKEIKEQSDLPSGRSATNDLVSPGHSADYYDEIAQKLENIVKKSTKIKSPSPGLKPPSVDDNEALAQQLVKLLCSEGDVMNTKIQENPELINKLSRLSYRSFENILDFFGKSQAAEAPPMKPSASPTLQRIAVSMEVYRRMVTATGTQRLNGHAERYMDNFVPWVKSHGGWENVLNIERTEEWD